MANIRKRAKEFVKSLEGDISSKAICRYLTKLGVSVVEIDPYGHEVIAKLHLASLFVRNYAVTYLSSNGYVVFLNRNTTFSEKQTALLREAGHILLEHKSVENAVGNTIVMQKEADAFVTYVLSAHQKSGNAYIKWLPVSVAFFCLLAVIGCLYLAGRKENSTAPVSASVTSTPTAQMTDVQNPVYITKSGEVYHKEQCRHIKGRNTFSISLQDAVSANYRPCKDCMP